MKPRYEDVRQMLLLALGCWNDFLNTLNSPLWSVSHLHDETFFGELYKEFAHHQEIREALFVVAFLWERTPEQTLYFGSMGLTFSKPTAIAFQRLINPLQDEENSRLVSGMISGIDMIEYQILQKEFVHQKRDFPSPYKLSRNKKTVKTIQKYEKDMRALLTCADPIVRAGIEFQLVQRGFQV
jgi:hypothetical protein